LLLFPNISAATLLPCASEAVHNCLKYSAEDLASSSARPFLCAGSWGEQPHRLNLECSIALATVVFFYLSSFSYWKAASARCYLSVTGPPKQTRISESSCGVYCASGKGHGSQWGHPAATIWAVLGQFGEISKGSLVVWSEASFQEQKRPQQNKLTVLHLAQSFPMRDPRWLF